ncbi:MAG: YggS family pyridoxal phosphate-dependent enzyme [Candidatus Omnitrophica bacterium]|nr:YggS family pyridoxal phosphate-dependent enzyme [Candidatus Omnitrophota bacterium]
MIADNIKFITQRIASSCEKSGRSADDVILVCVTKEAAAGQIEEAIASGISNIGENRVKDATAKYGIIGDRVIWHLIGHLQTNKVKEAVRIFSLIHSVDSARLAREIDREAKRIGKRQDVLIQVNVSGEKTKFGISPDEIFDLIEEITPYSNISVKGLMTIAPEVEDPEKARPYFRALREIRDNINAVRGTPYAVRILSMGMSNDFEVAVEEGSNMVRIGRAIFEDC